ncbi:SpoIIE family protein phosphatase [Streptomyces shenzhenensis]|uniref:SpoIIE family protein phosphatase n=1 Tax=Streptomyces shenzhenensis TaxID=943815 RepID=UPI001F35A1F2|nr:SpoIIE family protein phosphatase [Streptomyces shenzhenensis]
MPHHGSARTGLPHPGTAGTGVAGTGSPPGPGTPVDVRVLTFAGAAAAVLYVPDAGSAHLRSVDTAGYAPAAYGLPERLPLSGSSPAACAFRDSHAVWLTPTALASCPEGCPAPPRARTSLGALPLVAEGERLGCLVVVSTGENGFEAEQQRFLERYAHAVTGVLETRADGEPPSAPLSSALRRMHVGSFVLVPETGVIDADETLRELVGIKPDDFDGKADSLLAHALPEDLHALMSVLEPSAQTFGRRELDFRVRCPTGEMRWLSLTCRVASGTDDRPEQVLGVVTATSVLRRGSDDVSRIQWLTAALDEATTVREVSHVVITALREPLSADRVALAELQNERLQVTLLDPPQPVAWPRTWRLRWRAEWPDAPLSALPTLQTALRDGRMGLWPAATAVEPGLDGIGPGGLAVLPLPAKGQVVGLCLVGWDRPHEFAPEERSLLIATASLAGQALTRAHAHDAEQELAAMLQRSLLPRRLPELPGGTAVARYLPARRGLQVGGDWYDVIALSEDRVALVIGDVQGHSAAAATIMGQMRTAVRAYAVEGHPPDVVVSYANRLLVGMETDLFATCCYAELDMDEGDVLFVRAGHVAPLLRHPDGSTEEVEVEGGLPLGISMEADFPMTAVALTPGMLLALVTDGLVEAAELSLDEGMRRARATLATADPSDPGRVADALLGDQGCREDDVALLLLRYDGMKTRPIRSGWVVWRLPDAVMHARRFTARTLRRWKVEEATDAVLLVVSELVTNALIHTQGPVRLELTLRGGRVRVCVSDSSPRAPARPVIVDWESTGGRGLLLVEAVSESFGTVPMAGGKQVCSEIAVPRREPAPVGADPGIEDGDRS